MNIQNFERLLFHYYFSNLENVDGRLYELRYVFNILFNRYKGSNTVTDAVTTKIDAAEMLLEQLFDLMTEIVIYLEFH